MFRFFWWRVFSWGEGVGDEERAWWRVIEVDY